MSISNHSIVHYTRKLQNLKSILKDRSFKLKYCLETIDIYFGEDSFTKPLSIAIPMVCFCDIPFMEIHNHVKEYGFYGIGLSKDWAIKNCINPVVYLTENSWLIDRLAELKWKTDDLFNVTDLSKLKDFNKYYKLLETESLLFCYIKNYSGDINTKKVHKKNYLFYNEREWRYVSKIGSGLKHIISEEEYKKNKDAINKDATEHRLYFSFEDITYIILQNNEQIPRFIKFLKNNFKDFESDILSNKILTIQQLKEDF